jgi:hypothetical protein
MSTVHLLPEGQDSPIGTAGDHVLRPKAGEVEVGRVESGGVAWLGTVPRDALPDLPAVDSPQEAPDGDQLTVAVQGVVSAFDNRGG